MAAPKLYNRAGVATTTTGTGTVTLGSAIAAGTSPFLSSWRTFANSGVSDAEVVQYLILDNNGAWEYGTGTYTSSGTTLSRTLGSSSTGSLLNLSGNAQVFIAAVSSNIVPFDGTNIQRADGTGIVDDSGNELLLFGKVASAENYVKLSNNAVGSFSGGPTFEALGDDTDISLNFVAKGGGYVNFTGTGAGFVHSGAAVDAYTERTDTHGDDVDIGSFTFYGRDSAAGVQQYASVFGHCVLDNSGAEEGRIDFWNDIAGSLVNCLSVGKTVNAKRGFVEKVIALTDGATPALDAALGNIFYLDAAGNRTIAVPSNATDGQKIVIRHFANGGARTLALNTGAGGFRFGTDITALTATTSGAMDYIGCIYNGVDSFWDVVSYVKGF